MGQFDKILRLQVLDADAVLRAELHSLSNIGIEVVVPDVGELADLGAFQMDRDVVVINVETAAGLALVAQVNARENAPPIIAVGAKGFDRKSLEHVLLLAEVRGAIKALPKPFCAAELAMAATQVRRSLSPHAAPSHAANGESSQLQT